MPHAYSRCRLVSRNLHCDFNDILVNSSGSSPLTTVNKWSEKHQEL